MPSTPHPTGPRSTPTALRVARGHGRRQPDVRAGLRGLLLIAGILLLGACGDDPFQREWEANPETATIFSLARPELELASAFSFRNRRTLQIQEPAATGEWDVTLDTRDGELVFLLPGAFGVVSDARIASFPGLDFDDLREAPSDTAAYVADEAMVEPNTVYVVRTTQRPGLRCVFFAKFETTAVDLDEESVEFRFDGSPFCNDRDLVPPDS